MTHFKLLILLLCLAVQRIYSAHVYGTVCNSSCPKQKNFVSAIVDDGTCVDFDSECEKEAFISCGMVDDATSCFIGRGCISSQEVPCEKFSDDMDKFVGNDDDEDDDDYNDQQ